tara:strand:- start:204 stop:602 length:399 start_codon:yes stop_codon:yes gene_type:complete
MAFKMNNPMKKNFGSALKKAIPEDAEGLNKMIKSEEGKEAAKNMGFTKDPSGALLMKKDNAPMMRMDPSAMKAMGQPAPMKTDRGIGAVKEKNKPKFGDKDYKTTELDEFYDEENDPEGLFVGSGGSSKKDK